MLSYGHGMVTPLDEAAYLVSFVMGLPPDYSPELNNQLIGPGELDQIREILERRIRERKPLAYILGQTWLAGYLFFINEHTLIPRSPIAELISSQFSPWWSGQGPDRILDLCTGSGCLGILAAKHFTSATVDLADIDKEALKVASKNVAYHQLEGRVAPLFSDVFDQLPKQTYDIILANPPYVPVCEQSSLPSEYHHEPEHALFAGEKGLDIAVRILAKAAQFLSPRGILVMEVGESAHNLQERFSFHHFTWLEFEQGGDGVCLLTYEECKRFAVD